MKLLLLVIAALMVSGTIYILDNAVTGSDQASDNPPESVDRFIPSSGATVLAQSTVGVDLKRGYDAYLVVEGEVIRNSISEDNADGLQRDPANNTVEYHPGAGQRVPRLSTPKACVDAFVWRVEDGPETAKQTRWCFTTT